IAGGVPEANGGDEDTLDNVFDALSIPVFINAPVQGLTFEVTPGEDSNGESFLIYGFLEEPDAQGNDNSRPVPLDQVRFDADARFVINATVDGGSTQPGTIAISPATITLDEGDTGTTTATFTVTRTGGTDGAVSVQFATADGSATAGEDYVAKTQTVTFAAGDGVSKTITVDINGDIVVEPNETFTATLSGVTGGATLGTSTSTVTITNDDVAATPGTISISPATISIAEGNSGTKQATFTITRTGGTSGAVSVQFATANGTATAGEDYVAKTQTVNFADGDGAAKTVTVDINGDTAVELDETFTATLSGATGGASLGASTSTVTITNDDVATNAGTISISPATISIAEGNSGTKQATFTISRTGGTTGVVSVQFATANGTATAGSDYVAKTQTVTFADGDGAAKTVTVDINGDTAVELDETFTATLSGATGGASLGTTTSTVTITNDDVATSPGTISISPATISIVEGNSGTKQATFTIARTGGTAGAVSVQFATANGTATAGSDYVAKTQTVTFADGDGASKTVTVDINGDTAVELDETFTASISAATGGASLGTTTSTVTITNDDVVVVNPGTISLSPATISVNESGPVATFTVTRTGGSDGVVSAVFATSNGTAIAGADYTGKTETVTFADGDSATKTITVSIIDDTVDEPNETFNVTLTGATGGAVLGASASAVTIIDNDPTDPGTGSTVAGSIFIDKVENLQEVINSPGLVAPFRDGVKDADESGLAGVRVELRTASGELVATAFTDMNGSYRFTGVSQGSYRLRFGVSAANTFLSGSNEIPVTVGASGSSVAPGNLPVLGLSASMSNLDILASSYLRGNSDAASASNNGRRGGSVALDSSGHQIFFMAAEGFDNVDYSELLLNDAKDAAILTIVDGTDIKTALLDKNDFVISRDGSALQFFGGIEELGFVSTSNPLNSQGFSQAAIDALFSRAAEIANNN
uniref:Calx-beta domain-containing protein n=1 Tax=Novipirellula sp. TaxID=2795430 RepID=UPI00356B3A20